MFLLKLTLALAIIIAALVLMFRLHKQIKGDSGFGAGSKESAQNNPHELEEFIAAYRRDKTGGAAQSRPDAQPAAAAAPAAVATPNPLPAAAKPRAAFLSGAGKVGFLVLKAGLPDHHVFANTRVADLLDGPANAALGNMRVDLLICNKELAIVAAVGLPNGVQSDSALEREKEQRLRAAGIRYVRFEAGAFPKPADVRRLVYPQ
jgi:hypothetical protein